MCHPATSSGMPDFHFGAMTLKGFVGCIPEQLNASMIRHSAQHSTAPLSYVTSTALPGTAGWCCGSDHKESPECTSSDSSKELVLRAAVTLSETRL